MMLDFKARDARELHYQLIQTEFFSFFPLAFFVITFDIDTTSEKISTLKLTVIDYSSSSYCSSIMVRKDVLHRRKKEKREDKNKYYKMKVGNAMTMILIMTAWMVRVEEVSAAAAAAAQVESVSRLLLELS